MSSYHASHSGIFSKARLTLLIALAATCMTSSIPAALAQAVKLPPLRRLNFPASISTPAMAISIQLTATFVITSTSPSTPASLPAPLRTSTATSESRPKATSLATAPTTPFTQRKSVPSFATRKIASFPSPTPWSERPELRGPALQPGEWGWGVTSGVGIDYVLPFFNNRIAVRPIQADFHYTHVDFGPLGTSPTLGGTRPNLTPIASPLAAFSASARSPPLRPFNSAVLLSQLTSFPAIPSQSRLPPPTST